MSWSHSSRIGLVLLVLLAAVATPIVGATAVEESAPVEAAQIGSSVDVTYTLTELFNETNSEWTLNVTTDLASPVLTVTRYDPSGNVIDQPKRVTDSTATVNVTTNTATVEVRVQGKVPQVSNFTYEPAQSITLAAFQMQGTGETIERDTLRPYSEQSQNARNALNNASNAIEKARQAGVSVSGAQDAFDNAEDAFDNENWDNAISLAQEAERKAENALESSEQRSTLLLVGAGVVVLLLLAGVVYWYLNRGESHDELG